ncbi:uncharacterized protein EV420DRAFT_1487506 [Desarmillaria tabescens]|uniref:Uncharacterized protein n=1 Tax=Armillaria tabescens TaxID=1929756 RepID=A0AA39J5I6_ARMTA|nr:uncharacterized protein EV420DRAFT_1487506 [Desarmillaria tabescens]KAK0436478.1 hypothetical protein EV420DRAFT_1487506 [Desarmillaria tabescens]
MASNTFSHYLTAVLTTGTAVYIPVPYRQPSSESLDGTVYGPAVARHCTVAIRPYTVYGTNVTTIPPDEILDKLRIIERFAGNESRFLLVVKMMIQQHWACILVTGLLLILYLYTDSFELKTGHRSIALPSSRKGNIRRCWVLSLETWVRKTAIRVWEQVGGLQLSGWNRLNLHLESSHRIWETFKVRKPKEQRLNGQRLTRSVIDMRTYEVDGMTALEVDIPDSIHK